VTEDSRFSPGLKNKLYRNPRRGVIFGVCAGMAEYFGFDINITRIVVAVGALFAMPMVCGAYIVLAFLLPTKEYTGTARDYGDPLEQQVRASPHDTLASVRYRFGDLDTRLQQLEKYVTSSRYKLDREFRKLQD
jgi:phage shock protein C